MNAAALAISRIKRLLDRVKPEKILEVEEFVEFLTENDAEKLSGEEIRKIEGIWEGLGCENLIQEKRQMEYVADAVAIVRYFSKRDVSPR